MIAKLAYIFQHFHKKFIILNSIEFKNQNNQLSFLIKIFKFIVIIPKYNCLSIKFNKIMLLIFFCIRNLIDF
jgi:hypothetical protein